MGRIVRVLLVATVIAVGVGVSGAGASGSNPSAAHLRFHLVRGAGGGVTSSGRYSLLRRMLVWTRDYHQSAYGAVATLLDERTGVRRTLSPPGCAREWSQAVFGGPWLLFDCGKSGTNSPSPVLYDLATAQWVPVPGPADGTACGDYSPTSGACVIVGVGRYWIELLALRGPSNVASYLLQNIRTGAVTTSPAKPGGKIAVDLNVPSGSKALCAPLRYPQVWNPAAKASQPGWLSFYGKTALVAGSAPAFGVSRFAYLERCGSSHRVKLPPGAPLNGVDGLSGSAREIVWRSNQDMLSGVYVRSMRRFRVSLSTRITGGDAFDTALSARRLYVYAPGDPYGATFRARLP